MEVIRFDELLENIKNPKPPLGLIPKYHYEYHRVQDIKGAIGRYLEVEMAIPTEWLEEYNEIIEKRKSNAK